MMLVLNNLPNYSSQLQKGHHLPPCIPTNSGWELLSPSQEIEPHIEKVPMPSKCVDYLTHDWEFEDLALSWKAVSRHSESSLNCVRLENASWRIWAKRRKNIPTMDPKKLNWYKDNDITWLYGPLLTNKSKPNSSSAPVSKSPSFDTLPTALKPALKKLKEFESSTPKKKAKLRFQDKVEQCIIIENYKERKMIKRLEPTFIKNEDVRINSFAFDDEVEDIEYYLNPLIHNTKVQPLETNTDLVQRCISAVATTYEVVCWCRNILF